MLGWDRYGFYKKRARTWYAELVFLYLLGFMGHIVHSSAYGARIVDALFLMPVSIWYKYDKKRTGTRYAKLVFLHRVGTAGHVVHSVTSGA
jgi:hypothetical protein